MNNRPVRLLLAILGLSATCRLVAAEPVELASLEWPPYVGAELSGGGYAQQVVHSALARAGLDSHTHYFPWARALQTALNGQVAGAFPEYPDEERERKFLYSAPFPGGAVGLYRRTGSGLTLNPAGTDDYSALAPLQGKRIALVRGYINHPLIDHDPAFLRLYSNSDEHSLRLLQAGRVDLAYLDFEVAEYLLQGPLKTLAGQVEPVLPALQRPGLHLIVPRNSAAGEALLQAFNQGLAEMRSDGSLVRLMREYGIPEGEK